MNRVLLSALLWLSLAGAALAQSIGPAPAVVNPNTVIGPASSTDNAIVLWDGTTGKLLKDQGATLTASTPNLINQTWNNAGVTFTGLKLNVTSTASAAGSLLADFQVGGVSKANINKSGLMALSSGTAALPALTYPSDPTTGLYFPAAGYVALSGSGLAVAGVDQRTNAFQTYNGAPFGLATATNAADVLLYRDAANTLALRNGVNAQTFNVYNSFTDASNYSRSFISYSGSALQIGTEGAGTGAATLDRINIRAGALGVNIIVSGSAYWNLGANISAAIDNFSDIGALGASRPRSLFLGTNATIGGQIIVSGIASDATHTDATVCVDTTSKQFYSGSGAVGICLGTSSVRYKQDIAPLSPGLADLMRLQTVSYRYLPGYGDPTKTLYGFTAEQTQTVLPQLVGLDTAGQPNSVDWAGLVPVIVNAIHDLQAEVDQLKAAK